MTAAMYTSQIGRAPPQRPQSRALLTGGTVNRTGSLVIRAEHIGSDTMLALIVRMVARHSAAVLRFKGSPTEWWVTSFAPSPWSRW